MAMAIAGAIQTEIDEHGFTESEAHIKVLLNDFSNTRVMVWLSGPQGQLLLPPPLTKALTPSAAYRVFVQDPKVLQLAGMHASGMQKPRTFVYGENTYFTCSIPLKGNIGVLRILEDVGVSPMGQRLNWLVLFAMWIAMVAITIALAKLALNVALSPIHRLENALDTISLNPEGTIEGMVVAADDQPQELQGIVHAYTRLSERLDVAWSRQNLFIKSISHELLTPITLITTSSRRLLRKSTGLSEDDHELLAMIHNESSRVSRIVRDLLDLARGDAGSLAVDNAPFDAAHLIRELVDDVELLDWGHRVVFQSDPNPKLPQEMVAIGDAQRLRQCVLNLMENAVKYSGEKKPVILSLEATQREILITVKDFGPGIPKQDWENVFLAFYRSTDHTPSNGVAGPSGSGIGLAIVKLMTEQMGGSVSVVASDATGTSMQIRLVRQLSAAKQLAATPRC
jgi:signal transduction histidine kinase